MQQITLGQLIHATQRNLHKLEEYAEGLEQQLLEAQGKLKNFEDKPKEPEKE